MPGKIKDLSGRKFGRLTVLSYPKPVVLDGHAYWPVVCDCDEDKPTLIKWVRGSKLVDQTTVSCGCQRADPEVRRLARAGLRPEDLEDPRDLDDIFDRGEPEPGREDDDSRRPSYVSQMEIVRRPGK